MNEECKSFAKKLLLICKKAGRKAVHETWAIGMPITILKDGWVVRKYKDGRIERVRKIY